MSRTFSRARRRLLGVAGVGVLGGVLGGAVAACATRSSGARSEAYPPIGRFATVDGVRMHYVDLGPSEAPAVVLIHGASGNLRDFTFRFADLLTPRYRVLAIDRPGFGHSERGAASAGSGASADAMHDPAAQARVMRGVVRAAGARRPIVVGHSWGASAALAWALDAPEETAAVVSLAGVSHPWSGSAGLLYDLGDSLLGGAVAATLSAVVSEERAKSIVESVFRPQSAPAGYADYVGVGLATRPETLRANARDVARLKPALVAQRARYPEMTTPVEILHGTADAIVPVRIHGARLAREAPAARLERLDGVGHMPHHVAADACVAAIDRAAARAGATDPR